MRKQRIFWGMIVLTVAVSVGATPPPQLVILGAATDAGLLTIVGVNLGGSAAVVQIAGQTLDVQSASDTQLVATMPSLPAGTYLLTVSRGPATVQRGTFSLSIGSGGAGGAIDSIAAGPGLTGGGASGDVTLAVDTTFLDGNYARLDAPNTFLKRQQIHGMVHINDDGDPSRPTLQVETNDPDVFVLEVWSHASTGCNRGISANTHSECSAAVVGGAFAPTGGTGGAFESRGNGGRGVHATNTHPTGGGAAVAGEVFSPGAVAGEFVNHGNGTILVGANSGGVMFRVEGDGTVRGSAFTDLAGNPIGGGGGDIHSVAAGPGLTGGGTSGDVTLAVDTSYFDDLYVRTDTNNGPFARLDIDNVFQGSQNIAGHVELHGGFRSNRASFVEFEQPDAGAFAVANWAPTGTNRAITAQVFSESSIALVATADAPTGGTGGAFVSSGDNGNGAYAANNHPTGGGSGILVDAFSLNSVAGRFRNLGGGLILEGQGSTWPPVFSVANDGTVSAFNFVSSSSMRYKTNVAELGGALQAIERLRPVTFDWTASGKRDVGLIAEEVAGVLPDAVAFDAEGPQGIDYQNLTALLIAAVKEQQQQIRELQRALRERE